MGEAGKGKWWDGVRAGLSGPAPRKLPLLMGRGLKDRSGWRIIDGQNRSRFVVFAILDFFSDTRFQFPWEIVNPCRLGLRLTG